MKDRLSKAEIRKDALQEGVTAASQVVGSVATIVTTAVSDIARTLGAFATEVFEIRDAARQASDDQDHEHDHQHVLAEPAEPAVVDPIVDGIVNGVEDGDGQPKDS